MTPAHWETITSQAQSVIEATIAELPPDVRAEADKVPVLFQEWNPDDHEILGTYGEFAPGEVSVANGPIVLYLGAREEFCDDEEGEDFSTEVRLTYLHELGHHLGWDEGDLEARGLE